MMRFGCDARKYARERTALDNRDVVGLIGCDKDYSFKVGRWTGRHRGRRIKVRDFTICNSSTSTTCSVLIALRL